MMRISYTGFEQCFYRNEQPFFPTEENVEVVPIDLGRTSSLKWSAPVTDKLILWEVECDLWELPFIDEGQIRALEQALDHFVDALVDPAKTFGVLLYKGGVNLPRQLLRSLAARLPEQVLPLLAVDASSYTTEEFLKKLKREDLAHFGLIVKGLKEPYALPAMGWGCDSPFGVYRGGRLLEQKRIPLALCVGEDASFTLPKLPCRVIPEALFTYEWEGVDQLIVTELSKEGKRKVKGFLATGAELLEAHQMV